MKTISTKDAVTLLDQIFLSTRQTSDALLKCGDKLAKLRREIVALNKPTLDITEQQRLTIIITAALTEVTECEEVWDKIGEGL